MNDKNPIRQGMSLAFDLLSAPAMLPYNADHIPQRNQKCICGSGLKFKKCCQFRKKSFWKELKEMFWKSSN